MTKDDLVQATSLVGLPQCDQLHAEDLADLSKKASSGKWDPGHLSDPTTKCNCRSILTDNMFGCVFTAPNPENIEERFRSEYPTDEESAANMLFVCELVNAFREGRLVYASPQRQGDRPVSPHDGNQREP